MNKENPLWETGINKEKWWIWRSGIEGKLLINKGK